MVLRTAALYGRDPRELQTSAEVLVLRGVHPTVDVAREALEKVRDVPLPEKPAKRRSVRTWVHSITVLLIFGGFLSAPSDERKEAAHPWLKASIGFLFGAAIWVTTWVLPGHVHGRDGLGLRDPRASTRTPSAAVLRRRCRQRAGGDAPPPSSARTAGTASVRSCARRSSSCPSPCRSGSSPTPTTSPPQHRHQLARRARRARRGLPRAGRIRPRQPAMTDPRADAEDSGPPSP